jgi:4-hydroxybenzoate polyprenyltransferase/phosphoserine phosphatase
MAGQPPLVVDLDGTLTPTDTLIESFIGLVKQSPLNLLRAPLHLLNGRADFKDWVAARSGVSPERLPYREPLLAYLRAEKQKGRRIVLATAAHRSIAEGVSAHLGLFDAVIATQAGRNLKGEAKLEAIRKEIGGEFAYAGDSAADAPIWRAAKAAVLVGVPPGVADAIRREVPVEREFAAEEVGLTAWLRAFRVHQWMKNLLLFVPLLTAFSFLDVWKLVTTVIAFFAFSFAASASYVLNDLWDLENDRAHPRKRLRPFASGRIPIAQGLLASAAALLVALALASAVSRSFLLMLLLYLALTSAYSWVLKERALIDVLTLSLLYTLRIIAGSVAIGIPASSWLLAFSAFMFLSLALVKRCAELVSLEQSGEEDVPGRDYRIGDLAVLWPLGVGSALSAVVVVGLFISADETRGRYDTPELLWLVALGLVYWLARLWIKTSRGKMDDDPLVYAIKDSGSLMAVSFMIAVTLVAHFF